MTNPKIEKLNNTIAKIREKHSAYGAKLRELEKQKTDLENAEIVARFRSERLTEDDLNTLIKQKSGQTAAQPSDDNDQLEEEGGQI